ncbi:hypothetical protein [Aliarcobacter butzleri]|uniref:hypothetical protein n=1 Tax=Aliarcobacter butzleri TaxID=28197 RepID=UPI001260CDC6|nr:hypothetical protein [Aliarcobacter butzleri]
MIKNLILITLTAIFFQGCVVELASQAIGLEPKGSWFGYENNEIKEEFKALNNEQKLEYFNFVKEDCLYKAKIEAIKEEYKNNKKNEEYFINLIKEDYFNYLNLEYLEGTKGNYYSTKNKTTAEAVLACHNQFFKEHNIVHTKTTEKAN